MSLTNNEFIVSNSNGTYASFDLSSGNTRKYHGLFIKDNHVVWASNNEFIRSDSRDYSFSGNMFSGKNSSDVQEYLTKAFFLPYPTQIFKINNKFAIKKWLELDDDYNILCLKYEIFSPERAELVVQPLITYRHFHQVNPDMNIADISLTGDYSELSLNINKENFKLTSNAYKFTQKITKNNNHYYPIEELRGYPAHEDLFQIGEYIFQIYPGRNEFYIQFEDDQTDKLTKAFKNFFNNNDSLLTDISRFNQVYDPFSEDFSEYLIVNARKLLKNTNSQVGIKAGYHWFGEWGRDTFIAFKGLLLARGDYNSAKKLIQDWLSQAQKGLIPNQLDHNNYNTIDATLWLFVSCWYYYEETEDKEFIGSIISQLEKIIFDLTSGTSYGIKVNRKGFLIWEDASEALTWMDAKSGEQIHTPRTGAAVEIQALWFNSLHILEKLAFISNHKIQSNGLIDEIQEKINKYFEDTFWLKDYGYYADYVHLDDHVNTQLRPNQLLLYSLPFRLGNNDNWKRVKKKIDTKLYTNLGLRTLSPDDDQFDNNYEGDQFNRDRVYHQGIVWPWLHLPYFLAIIKDESESKVKRINLIEAALTLVWDTYLDRQIPNIPEVYSHHELKPNGAILQAWSVAAYLEILMELGKLKYDE